MYFFIDQLHPVQITGKHGEQICARYVVVCAGLFSDRLAKLSGSNPLPQVVPFRGEYLKLSAEKGKQLIYGNIYPVSLGLVFKAATYFSGTWRFLGVCFL